MTSPCSHEVLCFDCSPLASEYGYFRPSLQQRQAAAGLPMNGSLEEHRFCAPLVLPGDDLAEDPDYPAQSIQEWRTDADRNPVETSRRTLYVVAPPAVDDTVPFMESWREPNGAEGVAIERPRVEDMVDYLRAFYHGMDVKRLSSRSLCFTSWSAPKRASRTPRYVGLKAGDECVRIRTRASHDGIFSRQLNLDDLLDAAIGILPSDAYAMVLVVPWDIYERADDDFACGRAYGGSRVAAISTARYHPGLDRMQDVERLHAWPASHCQAYMTACCSEARPAKRRKGSGPGSLSNSPLRAAVAAYAALPSLVNTNSAAALSSLWLARACRTASHELGHCFGIDHCVYYACAMQGTTSLREDARQPLFVCPVDVAKILEATGTSSERRDEALLAFCAKHPQNHSFASLAAWIRVA